MQRPIGASIAAAGLQQEAECSCLQVLHPFQLDGRSNGQPGSLFSAPAFKFLGCRREAALVISHQKQEPGMEG